MTQSAGAIIVTHDNRILLQRRDDKPDLINAGKLAVFGGYLEDGEEVGAALVRELHEELGVTAKAEDLLPVSDETYALPDSKSIRIRHFLWFEKIPQITGIYEGSAAYFDSVTAIFDSGQAIAKSIRVSLEHARAHLPEHLR